DPEAAEAALATLRRMTDRPCFPQALSSMQVRRVLHLRVPGAEGLRPARLYVPWGRPRGIILFLHGGGFVHCGLNSHHGICCRLARQSGAVVLSFDYRLAPEHPFPAGLDDCRAALRFISGEAWRWGGRVAVAGDSAGGTLAAVLAQDARLGAAEVAAQLLFYPSLYGARESESSARCAEGYLLTTRLMRWYGEHYVRREEDLTDPGFAPGLADDVSGLAPAIIVTAGFDPLCDDGRDYARRLSDAGVPVRYRCLRGSIHGVLNFYSFMRAGRAAIRFGARGLRVWLRSPS
ncbi:alpha/beta hydrolase, partial [Ameyamaea chiangmaiensis]|nr:alpha/beta hydrolase [Ameyamaea chiangmaiensis]